MTTKTLPSGLMLHDDRMDVSLQEKLAACCERFKSKFGVWPTTVWLHPETLGAFRSPDGFKLAEAPILRDCFLVGPLL